MLTFFYGDLCVGKTARGSKQESRLWSYVLVRCLSDFEDSASRVGLGLSRLALRSEQDHVQVGATFSAIAGEVAGCPGPRKMLYPSARVERKVAGHL